MTDGHDIGGHDTDSQDDAPETRTKMAMTGGRSRRRSSAVWHRHVRWRRPVEASDGRRIGFLGSLGAFTMAGLALLAVMVPVAGNDAASSGFEGCGSYAPLAPTGPGVVRPVSNQAELAMAMAAAQPGDTINLASGTYREIHYRQAYGHRSGSADRPIVIQAAAGAEAMVDGGQVDDPEMKSAIDVGRRQHIKIRGLTVRNRSFGLRSMGSGNITFEYNDVADVGHSGIVAQAYHMDPALPSSGVVIRCNRIHDTGRVAPEFGEGIYIGTGSVSVPDPTSNILIEGNHIFRTSNEGIDIKHHVTDVTIRDNDIHDLTPYYGGAISLGLNTLNWGPANYLVENNRIWNVSSGMYYAQAIAVAHGPTIIRNNMIWGIESETAGSWPWIHPIQIHGDDNTAAWAYGFGNPAANQVEITGNTVVGCQVACIDSFTDPGAVAPSLTMGVNVVTSASSRAAANDNDRLVNEADFIGPTTGTADAGNGPGSGLTLKVDTTSTTQATTTSTVAPTTSSRPTTTSPSTTTSTSATTSPSTTASSPSATSGPTTTTAQPGTTTVDSSTETAVDRADKTEPIDVTPNEADPTTTVPPIGGAGATTTTTATAFLVPRTTTTSSPIGAARTTTTATEYRFAETVTMTVRPRTAVLKDRPRRRIGWKQALAAAPIDGRHPLSRHHRGATGGTPWLIGRPFPR